MATHDYVIDNSTGANVRADINNVLLAIVSNNSNSSSPTTTYAYQWWADTSNGVLKIRNSANNAWVELLQLDGTLTLENGSASTPALAFRDDLNTGIYSAANDRFNISVGGVDYLEVKSSTIVFNDTGADTDFRIEGDNDTNLFYVDAGNDRIGIGTNSPDSILDLSGSGPRITFNDTAGTNDIGKIFSSSGALFFQQRDGSSHGEIIFRTEDDTSAVERLRISSTGKLTVTGPEVKVIDVTSDNTDKKAHFTTGHYDTAEEDFLGLRIIGGNADNVVDIGGGSGQTSYNSATKIRFYTSANDTTLTGSERMRIDPSGNVGIATTSLSDRFTIGDGDLKFFHPDAGSAHRTTFIEFGNSSNRITSESNFGSGGSSGYAAGYKFTTKNFNGSAFETLTPFVIQAKGNVGIGTTSPNNKLHVLGNIKAESSGATEINIVTPSNTDGGIYFNDGSNAGAITYLHTNDSMSFRSGGSTRMTLDSNGNLLIGRTSVGNTGNGHSIRGGDSAIFSRNATGETMSVCRNSSNGDFVQFRSGDSGNASSIGEISKNGGNVVYGGTSDYRLKENEAAISDGITRIKLLKPIRFNFKKYPNETVDGFFAHEVTPAVPEAVVGDKDDSNRMQSLDQSKLVPLLTAALQEAISKIEVLETKVAALEAG
tara:strand:+ start:9119 stop:11086 length:1968 start_codon:yes stop_codon:yes gene_type:complete